jgi:hypothetical protein
MYKLQSVREGDSIPGSEAELPPEQIAVAWQNPDSSGAQGCHNVN